MKIIFRLISAALFLIAAAACNLSEINNPDDPNNNGSGKKEYSITAKIIQTRVLYTDGAVLKQEWEQGDKLIGYYVGLVEDGIGVTRQPKSISFTVEKINSNGSANLKLELGTLPEDGTTIALLYDPYGDSELSSGSLSVDLRSQNFDIDNQGTSVLPAFMSASAEYSEDEGATFVFQNDCAIIEVDGIYKSEMTDEGQISSVSSINIENVIATGSYTFDPSESKFTLSGSGTETEESITVTCNRRLDWGTGVLDKPVFLAVIPTEADDERTIDVTFSDGITDCEVEEYGRTAFAPGKCYVVYPKDMVAKTADNQYFECVADAFEHAKVLSGDTSGNYDTKEENVVTLLKYDIYGLVGHSDKPVEEEIEIDYPVTLDLNGCSLYLGPVNEDDGYDDIEVSESFYVENGGDFTITGPNDIEDPGTIWSEGNSAESLIKNEGTVIIENGTILQYGIENTDKPIAIQNYDSLIVEGGNLSSDGHVIDSYDGSDTTICGEDAEISSSKSYSISIQGEDNPTVFTMTGGSVGASTSGGGVNLKGSNVIGTISRGKINGGHTHALLVEENATCEVSGGYIYSQGIGGVPSTSAVYLDYASIDILGGVIGTLPEGGMCISYAIYCVDSNCKISDVTIMNSPTDGGNVSSIYCTTEKKDESSFVMSGGKITGGNIKIFLDKNIEGEISDGTISSSDCYAIRLSGSELTIDEKNDNTITISTDSENGYPAIFVEESESITSSLTIESGKISGLGRVDYVQDKDEDGQLLYEMDEESGENIPVMIAVPYCGAIQLTGNVIANINGGEIYSKTGYAITVDKDSECNISGNNTSVECDGGCVLKNEGTTTISGGTLTSNSEDYVFCPGTVANYSTIKKEEQSSPGLIITGGDIVSENMYALYNEEGAMAIVTGGDLLTNGNDDAVVNYGNLIIGDPSASTTSNDAITITSSNSLFPAIYCSAGGTFYMYYGTVKGPAGAVELNSGTTANISGGNFESAANTIFIHNGSSCTISGGQFVSTSTEDPTVFVYNPSYGSSSSLTINGTPLFYSASKIKEGTEDGNIKFAVPVCAINDGGTNYVSVTIQGGYYYSSGSLLYCGNEDVLTISSGTTIYSNVNRMEYRISGSGSGLSPYSFTTINDNEASPTTVSCFAFTDPLEFRYKLIK